jgi:choline dehydrogenase-like flavoprotein
MIIDARALPTDEVLVADVCIVGAGAAGISIAQELSTSQFSVLLIEGGGLKFEHRSQFLHRGRSRGRAYLPPENTRRRQFGGTTAAWFGRCRPLDAIDFESRAWFPNSGWPIEKREVDAHLPRAADLCQLESDRFEVEDDRLRPVGLESKLFQFSPPTHFGQAYLNDLRASASLRVVLHANAAEIVLEDSGGRASRITCLTRNRKRVAVEARIFILAAGGLENARLLLNSRRVHANGVGNAHDAVGRFFMEHIYGYTAAVESLPVGFPQEYLRLNYDNFQRNLEATPAIGLPETVLREQRLPNGAAFLIKRPVHKTDDRFFSARFQGFIQLMEVLGHRRAPSWDALQYARETAINMPTVLALASKAVLGKLKRRSQYAIHLQTEAVPNPESRITLSDSRDSLGLRQLCVDWRLLPQDLDGWKRWHAVIARGLKAHGFRLRDIHLETDEDGWPVFLPISKHHMGTTRMSSDPRNGVVDGDCRVHGVRNLYVAGSSVFPTAGMANPTMTIVALAVRLADHIRRASP